MPGTRNNAVCSNYYFLCLTCKKKSARLNALFFFFFFAVFALLFLWLSLFLTNHRGLEVEIGPSYIKKGL